VTPTPGQLAGLNLALNEARLLSFDLDLGRRDGLYSGDPRIRASGIHPLKK